MITINFLQFGMSEESEPKDMANDLYSTQHELTGELVGDLEWEVKAILKEDVKVVNALNSLKENFDFEVFSVIEDGQVIATEEDIDEEFSCNDCDKIVYGNGSVYITKANIIYCLDCYHKKHEDEE